MRYYSNNCGMWADYGLGAIPVARARLSSEVQEISSPISRGGASTVSNQNWGQDACSKQGDEYDAKACPNGCVRYSTKIFNGTRGTWAIVDKQCCISEIDSYGRPAGESCNRVSSVNWDQLPDSTWRPSYL